MRKPCLDCGVIVENNDSRCARCLGRRTAISVARKRRLYGGTWRILSEDARAGGRCAYCGATEDLTLDHVIPGTTEGGVRILCRSCNGHKGATTDKAFLRNTNRRPVVR